jgi:hypothetical protein
MTLVSLRSIVGSLVLMLAAVGPVAADEPTIEGTWVLDMKSSKNVPEAQKGVDLKVGIRDTQLTITKLAGENQIGEPMVLMLDGKARPQEVGGQRATVSAKWLVKDKKFEHVISMMQQGSVFATTQTIVTEVSDTGGTLMRKYTIRQAKETQERALVYRRKP